MPIAAATIAEAFQLQAERYGVRTFSEDKHQKAWRTHSWTVSTIALNGCVGAWRASESGGATGLPSWPKWTALDSFDQAVLGLGAVVVAAISDSGAEETRHIIADSGARLIGVYGEALVAKVRALASYHSRGHHRDASGGRCDRR